MCLLCRRIHQSVSDYYALFRFSFFLFSRTDPADIKWARGFPPLLTQTKTCVPPPTPTHTWGCTKEGGGQRKQTQKPEHTLVVGASGHKEAMWPQHFKPTIWGSLMCIDSYCTKGTKTIIGCFVCSNSSPKIPWYVQWSNLCLQSERSHRVCEIHANKTILCFSEMNLVCFPCVLGKTTPEGEPIHGSMGEKHRPVQQKCLILQFTVLTVARVLELKLEWVCDS